jgi:hypothetical protein
MVWGLSQAEQVPMRPELDCGWGVYLPTYLAPL